MPKNKGLVLVTGGAGFIGSHLVDALIRDGFLVRVLDNLAPPTHNGKLPDWFNKKARFIKGDVRNKKDWQRALKGVSYVFHLAAYMDQHPDLNTYIDTNVKSIALLFEAIAENKLPVKKIICASSQSVYGEGKYYCRKHGILYPSIRSDRQLRRGDWKVYCPVDHSVLRPLPEKESDQLVPVNMYGISKKIGEEVLYFLGRNYGIPTVSVRYSIVHGPRQSFRHFYSGALRQLSVAALSGEDLKIHEDGGQIRDFVSVYDAVQAHLVVLKDPKANFGVYNIGSGVKTRIADLAKAIIKLSNPKLRYEALGLYRIGTPRNSIMDIKKIRSLGWKPRYAVQDNVREYLEWIKYYSEAQKYLKRNLEEMKKAGVIKNAAIKP